MAASAPHTIILKGDPPRFEQEAGATITPGDLVEFAADDDLQRHSTSGGNAAAMFAIENELGGDDIDHDYLVTENVVYVHAQPGDTIFAWLEDGQNVARGAPLESAAAGSLQAIDDASGLAAQNTQSIVAIAEEDKDISASSFSARQRIRVRVL